MDSRIIQNESKLLWDLLKIAFIFIFIFISSLVWRLRVRIRRFNYMHSACGRGKKPHERQQAITIYSICVWKTWKCSNKRENENWIHHRQSCPLKNIALKWRWRWRWEEEEISSFWFVFFLLLIFGCFLLNLFLNDFKGDQILKRVQWNEREIFLEKPISTNISLTGIVLV